MPIHALLLYLHDMSLFNIKSSIVVTCHKHVAPYLATEIADLGFHVEETFITGVRLQGTLTDCIKLNVHLRCASQVLFQIDAFEAFHPDDIYDNVIDIVWEELIPKETYISVTSNVSNDSINNSMYANLRVKDAVVDRLREVRGERPETGAALDGAVIHLYWKGADAVIFLDTSGDSLGRHGYRKIPGRAPMLESLAAATIIASKWDRKSPFVNPMCGSGTLAIEAALMAANITPGYFRSNYAFMHLQDYDPSLYAQVYEAMKANMLTDIPATIIASDLSYKAVENAELNALAAGVKDMISFEQGDFAETTVPEIPGVVFFNPEYGERLGDSIELEDTYARMGDFMKQSCKGYFGYIFTGNMELAKKIGLKAKRRIPFYNSKIECRLLEFELYAGSKKHKTDMEG